MTLEAAGWTLAALAAAAVLIAPLAWLLGRATRWTPAARWFWVALLLAPALVGLGFLLVTTLDNGDCDDICATPAWRGLIYAGGTGVAAAGHALLAGLLWLSGRRGSSGRSVQPM